MKNENVMPLILNMAKRLGRKYGEDLVSKYREIKKYDIKNGRVENGTLPKREDLWPVSRLAKEYFPLVFPSFSGEYPGVPDGAIRIALKKLLSKEELIELCEMYKVWNGKLVGANLENVLSEAERKKNAENASKASLEARGFKPWTLKEIKQVFRLAGSDDPSLRYHGGANLKEIAIRVNRTWYAVRTCLKKPTNRERYAHLLK